MTSFDADGPMKEPHGGHLDWNSEYVLPPPLGKKKYPPHPWSSILIIIIIIPPLIVHVSNMLHSAPQLATLAELEQEVQVVLSLTKSSW